jgi:hypothetical protein
MTTTTSLEATQEIAQDDDQARCEGCGWTGQVKDFATHTTGTGPQDDGCPDYRALYQADRRNPLLDPHESWRSWKETQAAEPGTGSTGNGANRDISGDGRSASDPAAPAEPEGETPPAAKPEAIEGQPVASTPEHDIGQDTASDPEPAAVREATKELDRLTAPIPVAYDALVADGQLAVGIARMGEAAQWRLGDLAERVATAHRNRSLQQFAEQIGVEYRTLLDYRRVSRAFDLSERSETTGSPWSVYSILASHPDRAALIKDLMTAAEARKLASRKVIQGKPEPDALPGPGSKAALESELREVTGRSREQQREIERLDEQNRALQTAAARNVQRPPQLPGIPVPVPGAPETAPAAHGPQAAAADQAAQDELEAEFRRLRDDNVSLRRERDESRDEIKRLKETVLELMPDRRMFAGQPFPLGEQVAEPPRDEARLMDYACAVARLVKLATAMSTALRGGQPSLAVPLTWFDPGTGDADVTLANLIRTAQAILDVGTPDDVPEKIGSMDGATGS